MAASACTNSSTVAPCLSMMLRAGSSFTSTDTLAALHRQRGISRIELAGLDHSGVVALLEAAAGQSLDAAGVSLARAVYRETDGNPFFVSEVLRHLSETGAIRQDTTGGWVAESALEQLALPDSVRVVIGARVGRLGTDARRVLSVASVIGRDFDLDLLARATKTSEDDLLDILDAAASVALVREVAETGRYSFAHALIQHTLYEDLGHNRRARSHRQVAEALEDLCGDRPGARVGEPGEFLGGLADSVQAPRFSTVVGLVQYGAHRLALGSGSAKGKRLSMVTAAPSMDKLAQRFKTWLQDFF